MRDWGKKCKMRRNQKLKIQAQAITHHQHTATLLTKQRQPRRLTCVLGSAVSRVLTPMARPSKCFSRRGVIASCVCALAVGSLVRVDAFASSTKLVLPRQQAHRTTTPAVCMSSSTRKESGQDVPSAREEGKRRTPQEIAGVRGCCLCDSVDYP